MSKQGVGTIQGREAFEEITWYVQGFILFNVSEQTDVGTIQGQEVFDEITWYVQRLYATMVV